MNNPINRTTVQVDNNKYRVYPKGGPLFYKKSDGTYGDIDHTFNDTTSTIGDISLMDKGVVSVGKRKGNNPHKVVGIRPDNNQHLGTQQLEFSLVNVELDGESQEFNVEDDLEIKLRASKVFQLVKINKDFKDFKIEFDIHAKSLELQNSKYTETTTIRDYGFNLTDLGENIGNTIISNYTNYNALNKDIPFIDCLVGKITDDYITVGEYTNEEEFGDSDLSSYILNNNFYPNGSSVYYKDSIVLYCKSYNIENIEDVFVSKMCKEYGLETIWEDNKNGKYFTKNDKKVAGYYSIGNDFFMFINTKDIESDIKDLFKRKTFESTSFLNITLDNFKSTLNNIFNIDLKIELDNNYYEPINDKFVFKINKENMYIGKPLLFDEDYKLINNKTTHSLKQNNDGSYRYTKYFDTDGYYTNKHNTKYIDATLYVSEAEDNLPYQSHVSSTARKKTSAYLTTTRNLTTGNAVGTDIAFGTNVGDNMVGDQGVVSGGQTTTYTWHIFQTHYVYDSLGITETVSDLAWVHPKCAYMTAGGSHNDISIIALKSNTEGGNATSNYNDFVGHTSGWDDTDVTEYSGETVIDGYEEASVYGSNIASYVEETVTLNSDAKTDIKDDDTFKLALVDYDQYYLDSIDTTYGYSASGRREMWAGQIDDTNVPYRPYLEYTLGEEEAVTYNATFFGSNF
jgi:hypothetical protein